MTVNGILINGSHLQYKNDMGLFYAYLKDANSDKFNRHLITFVNRETADEWWRMISTHTSPYVGRVKRISPQFYVQSDLDNNHVAYFLNHPRLPDSGPFSEKMFISLINRRSGENPTAIPPIEITDHISGRWYFIRSKADQWSHWYFRTGGACLVCGDASCDAVHVSSEYRTKFCVRVRNAAENDSQVPENFVMIGKDEIVITTPNDYTVYISDAGELKAAEGRRCETDLLLDDLKDRFITRAEKQVHGEVWERVVAVRRELGEAWELV